MHARARTHTHTRTHQCGALTPCKVFRYCRQTVDVSAPEGRETAPSEAVCPRLGSRQTGLDTDARQSLQQDNRGGFSERWVQSYLIHLPYVYD